MNIFIHISIKNEKSNVFGIQLTIGTYYFVECWSFGIIKLFSVIVVLSTGGGGGGRNKHFPLT